MTTLRFSLLLLVGVGTPTLAAQQPGATLVVRLAAESLTVTRRPLELAAGKYSLEWDLVEVDTGNELRAYFAGTNAADILGSPVLAAPRIAAAIRERDGEASP